VVLEDARLERFHSPCWSWLLENSVYVMVNEIEYAVRIVNVGSYPPRRRVGTG
jgi:hypothetical protein